MPNLRVIHINRADLATSLAASTTSGSLVASLMQSDRKGEAHRSTGTSVTYTLTWTAGTTIGAVALPATNLTAAATMRVRFYSDTAATALLLDSGTNIACPGLNLDQWAWSGNLDANAFAYGGASKAVSWLVNTAAVKAVKIDLVDTTNPAGYIDCARIVAGPWWSPTYNGDFGASTELTDASVNTRSDAGDLITDRSTISQNLTFSLNFMPEADRAQLSQLMRANGVWKPVFVSILPTAGDASEQDHMAYGKRKVHPIVIPGFNYYSGSVEIEGW